MQRHELVTDEDREDIQQFIEDMTEKARELPQYEHTDAPRDDDASGAYLERTLFSGVTLVLDWGYLDAPSTYLVVDHDAPGYERDWRNAHRFINDCGDLYDELDAELHDVLGHTRIEHDESNSSQDYDVWHIHGVNPW